MQIPDPDTVVSKVLGQVLGHPFGQGGNQYAVTQGSTPGDFRQYVVHLVTRRAYLDLGVNQAGRTDNLLDYLT